MLFRPFVFFKLTLLTNLCFVPVLLSQRDFQRYLGIIEVCAARTMVYAQQVREQLEPQSRPQQERLPNGDIILKRSGYRTSPEALRAGLNDSILACNDTIPAMRALRRLFKQGCPSHYSQLLKATRLASITVRNAVTTLTLTSAIIDPNIAVAVEQVLSTSLSLFSALKLCIVTFPTNGSVNANFVGQRKELMGCCDLLYKACLELNIALQQFLSTVFPDIAAIANELLERAYLGKLSFKNL